MILIVRYQIIPQIADNNLTRDTQLALQFTAVIVGIIKTLLAYRNIDTFNNALFIYTLKQCQWICLTHSICIEKFGRTMEDIAKGLIVQTILQFILYTNPCHILVEEAHRALNIGRDGCRRESLVAINILAELAHRLLIFSNLNVLCLLQIDIHTNLYPCYLQSRLVFQLTNISTWLTCTLLVGS